MARTVSWLPRLADIRRFLQGSARTHYDRSDLERIFQLQPRAAGKLMANLERTEPLGRSHLVERETLLKYLAAVEGEGTAPEAKVSRRKPRTLTRRDYGRVEPAMLSRCVQRGKVEFTFGSTQELVDVMARIALCLENDEDLQEFRRMYDPEVDAEATSPERDELHALFDDLERREAAWKATLTTV